MRHRDNHATVEPDENRGVAFAHRTLVDVHQLAEMLGCSPRHVYRLSDAGKMPRPVKLGALVRCEEGLLDMDFGSGRLTATTEEGEEVLVEVQGYFSKIDQLAHFLDCVQEGRTPLTSGPVARKSLAATLSAYEGTSYE